MADRTSRLINTKFMNTLAQSATNKKILRQPSLPFPAMTARNCRRTAAQTSAFPGGAAVAALCQLLRISGRGEVVQSAQAWEKEISAAANSDELWQIRETAPEISFVWHAEITSSRAA